MRKRVSATLAVLLCAVVGVATSLTSASATGYPAGNLVGEIPDSGTPNILDGKVYAIAQVGNTMLLGGSFTQAQNSGSTDTLSRTNLLAFDLSTNQISTTFVPQPNSDVNALVPAGDGQSVYVGGNFTSIGGLAKSYLVKLNVNTGAVDTTFKPGTVTRAVQDLKMSNGRLWVGGLFGKIAGHTQAALATLNPTTGVFDPFMQRVISGTHNGGTMAVMKFDITPDGSTLVAIGNFLNVDGQNRDQIFELDLTGASATLRPWQTAYFSVPCASVFNTYTRDVSISPDGTYFVVGTTGAYGGTSRPACDSTSRWELNFNASGATPTWRDQTGGDTTWSVQVTKDVVYTGGHARWQNNPFAGDQAGQGAVSRPGIAALDPINGLPYSWNPTRARGVGVFDFLKNSQGLWVGSDTDRIGPADYYRARIALLPDNKSSYPAVHTAGLPNDLYSTTTGSNALNKRAATQTTFATPTNTGASGVDWTTVKGAFMINGELYLALTDGTFVKRTFDGTNLGPAVPVNAQDAITPLTDWRSDILAMTGMFYDSGRIYFTKAGDNNLYYRYFTPQSKIVGSERFVASGSVSGLSPSSVRGMFLAGNKLYWGQSDGRLRSITWQENKFVGTPVSGTATVVSGQGVDTNSWSNLSSLFLYQDAQGNDAGPPPVHDADVQFVGAASTNGSRVNHSVTIPASVQPGDQMMLFMTANSSTTPVTGPAGWNLVNQGSVSADGIQGFLWSRVAQAGDAGSTVKATTPTGVKSDVSVAAYRPTPNATLTVGDTAGGTRIASNTSFTTPQVNVPSTGASWVLSYWADKSSAAPAWTGPASQTTRASSQGSAGGAVSALLADSGGAVSPGTRGAQTATLSSAVTRVVVFSAVLTSTAN